MQQVKSLLNSVGFEKQFSHIDRMLKRHPNDPFWLKEKETWQKLFDEYVSNK